MNVVIWLLFEIVVLVLLVDFDIVLEIVVLLSMEMVFVFVLDIVVLEGGVINWCVIDFNVEVVFGVVV